jgi:hypothetical protein
LRDATYWRYERPARELNLKNSEGQTFNMTDISFGHVEGLALSLLRGKQRTQTQ